MKYKYKLEYHCFDNFVTMVMDDSEYVLYVRPWWRFWKWDKVKAFETELEAIFWVGYMKKEYDGTNLEKFK